MNVNKIICLLIVIICRQNITALFSIIYYLSDFFFGLNFLFSSSLKLLSHTWVNVTKFLELENPYQIHTILLVFFFSIPKIGKYYHGLIGSIFYFLMFFFDAYSRVYYWKMKQNPFVYDKMAQQQHKKETQQRELSSYTYTYILFQMKK